MEELISVNADGSLNFGNHRLEQKQKIENFEYNGDSYYIKSYRKMTKLEKNNRLVFASEPGASVRNFQMQEGKVCFDILAANAVQVTLELEENKALEVFCNEESIGRIKTNTVGKLNFSVESDGVHTISVRME